MVTQAQSNATANLPKLQGTRRSPPPVRPPPRQEHLRRHDGQDARRHGRGGHLEHPGVVGINTANANQMQLSAGFNTYKFDIGSTDTVSDLVNNINKSGIATATIDVQGQLQITGTGSDTLSVGLGKTTSGAFAVDATETPKLTGGATPRRPAAPPRSARPWWVSSTRCGPSWIRLPGRRLQRHQPAGRRQPEHRV